MKLCINIPAFYRVKKGQTVGEIACAFGVSRYGIVAANSLTKEAEEGEVLKIPQGGDLYTVRGGESKTLLCGSPAAFEKKNGPYLYVGQTVLL